MDKVLQDIAAVEAAITKVGSKIEEAKDGTTSVDEPTMAAWRQKEHDLRQKEHDLRQEKLALINAQAPGMFMIFSVNS